MSRKFLKFNSDKTEVLIIRPGQVSKQIQIPSLLTISHLQVCYLGLWLEPGAKCKESSPVVFLSTEEIVTQRKLYRLLYPPIPIIVMSCLLQIVQNSAARLLARAQHFSHVTLILASLHWLPVSFRVHFKVLLITQRPGLAPEYTYNWTSYSLLSEQAPQVSQNGLSDILSFLSRAGRFLLLLFIILYYFIIINNPLFIRRTVCTQLWQVLYVKVKAGRL